MSRLHPWRPEGLPHPTIQVRETRARAVQAGVCYALLLGLVTWLDAGVPPWWLVAAVLGCALVLWFHVTRYEVLAGPGWLSVRPMLRRRWVRTDRVVLVEWKGRYRSGPDVLLRDVDGRQVLLPLQYVPPRLQKRLAADLARAQEAGLLADEVEVHRLVGYARLARARRRRARPR